MTKQTGPHMTVADAEKDAKDRSAAISTEPIYVIRSLVTENGSADPKECWYAEVGDYGMIRNHEKVVCTFVNGKRHEGIR